jgi:hypothetical protein
MFKEKFTKGIFYLVVVGVVLGGVLRVGGRHSKLAQAGNTKRMEEYVGRVIIRAGFGEGPGQFGIYEYEQGVAGPNGIAVDNEGYIYIIDDINGRVNKFDREGKYVSSINIEWGGEELCVDFEGNLYIYATWPEQTDVRIFDKEGRLLGRLLEDYSQYSVEELSKLVTMDGVKVDRLGNVYVVYDDVEGRERLFKISPTGTLLKPLFQEEIPVSAKAVLEEEEYYLSSHPLNEEGGVIRVLDRKGMLKREILVKVPKRFIGEYELGIVTPPVLKVDRDNNIYVLLSLLDKGVPYIWFKDLVMKYNPRGELLAEIELFELPFEEADLVYEGALNETVDREGNVYRMVWSPKRGVEVIKYEKGQ